MSTNLGKTSPVLTLKTFIENVLNIKLEKNYLA